MFTSLHFSIFIDDIARLASKQNPETHEGKCVIACVSKKIKVVSITSISYRQFDLFYNLL